MHRTAGATRPFFVGAGLARDAFMRLTKSIAGRARSYRFRDASIFAQYIDGPATPQLR